MQRTEEEFGAEHEFATFSAEEMKKEDNCEESQKGELEREVRSSVFTNRCIKCFFALTAYALLLVHTAGKYKHRDENGKSTIEPMKVK